jgi:hypothetical protein
MMVKAAAPSGGLGVLEKIESRLTKIETQAKKIKSDQGSILDDIMVISSAQDETLKEILERIELLEKHTERDHLIITDIQSRMDSRDDIVRMLREHTHRLVKEKENLLIHLGMRRVNELNDVKDITI